jgi:hypothetical protein
MQAAALLVNVINSVSVDRRLGIYIDISLDESQAKYCGIYRMAKGKYLK